jgi:hypothetical protein
MLCDHLDINNSKNRTQTVAHSGKPCELCCYQKVIEIPEQAFESQKIQKLEH